jgi:dTMP kinase
MMASDPSARLPGTFIVFEGGEGSGKSTQVKLLVAALLESGYEALATREPGGSALAEEIRSLILQDSSAQMTPRCESLLFAAARAEHVASLIRPGLERGAVVVSDRFSDSSVAYQGAGRGLGADDVSRISEWATAGLSPDLTILLDIDPVVGLSRAQDPNRLESESMAFHQQVRKTLRGLADSDPDGHVVVAADQDPELVAAIIWDVVSAALRQAGGLASTLASVSEPGREASSGARTDSGQLR